MISRDLITRPEIVLRALLFAIFHKEKIPKEEYSTHLKFKIILNFKWLINSLNCLDFD